MKTFSFLACHFRQQTNCGCQYHFNVSER